MPAGVRDIPRREKTSVIHFFKKLWLVVVTALIPGAATAQAPAGLEDLVLMPGDAILVTIWREPTLSGQFLVDHRGMVTLPLLGERSVRGEPWPQIRSSLLEGYAHELRNPSIEITPLRRIYVLGEVAAPGLYPADPTISLAGVVAMAGGAGPDGDLRRVQVFREGSLLTREVLPASSLASVGIRSGDQVFLGKKPWVERNSTFLVTALLSATSVIVSLAMR